MFQLTCSITLANLLMSSLKNSHKWKPVIGRIFFHTNIIERFAIQGHALMKFHITLSTVSKNIKTKWYSTPVEISGEEHKIKIKSMVMLQNIGKDSFVQTKNSLYG